MPETTSLSFRVTRDKAERLERLAAATDRSKSNLLAQALDAYLEAQSWQVAQISAGLADARAGRTVAHGSVRDWLAGWGHADEGEPPE